MSVTMGNFSEPLMAGDYSSASSDSMATVLDVDSGSEKKSEGANLSLFEGVFVPVMLSIVGVIFFNRLGWITGQAGVGFTVIMFVLGYSVTSLTLLSLSAIATNGKLRGGGAYFLISRALGPSLGGAIGLIFFFANVAGAAVYLLGFSETFADLVGWGLDRWTVTLVAIAALCVLTVICYVGAALVAKTGVGIFVTLTLVVLFSLVSFLFQEKGCTEGFTAFSTIKTFNGNFGPHFTDGESFFSIFTILFPAVTGIMAGANLSGDLANAGRDLPTGSLLASLVSGCVYVLFTCLLGFTVTNEVLSDKAHYTILQDVAFWHVVVAVGVFAATLSSAMGSIIGGAKILQALARDDLFPILAPFKKGSGPDDEARTATLFAFVLVLGLLLMVSDLNTIAQYQSLFFLLSYGLVNFACFALCIQGSPNWRPDFGYYSWGLSLLGMTECFVIMFLSEVQATFISLILCMLIAIYVQAKGPAVDWGDVTQSILYHQLRKFLLRLHVRKQHVKFWRPQILVLTANNPFPSFRLMAFANNLKKGGLLLFGSVVTGNFENQLQKRNKLMNCWEAFVAHSNLKAFADVTVASSVRLGAQSLLQNGGIGAFRVNTAMIGFFDQSHVSDVDVEGMLRSASTKKTKSKKTQEEQFREDESMMRSSEFTGSPDNIKEVMDMFATFEAEEADHKSADGKSNGFGSKIVDLDEYLHMLWDVRRLNQHLMITRSFQELELHLINKQKDARHTLSGMKIDVWDLAWVTAGQPNTDEGVKWSFQMCLLMAWMLQRTKTSGSGWNKYCTVRVNTIVDTIGEKHKAEERVNQILKDVRITSPSVRVIALQEHNLRPDSTPLPEHSLKRYGANTEDVNPQAALRYKKAALCNAIICKKSKDTAVHFMPLLRAIAERSDKDIVEDGIGEERREHYYEMGLLSENLGPTVLMQASHSVFTSEI